MATDYYTVLGVDRDASTEQIKRAYRRLARELHPDVNPDPETLDRFKAVTNAYEVLSDPRKREVYDLGGDPLAGASGGPGQGPMGGVNFTDIFDAFFGQQTAQRGPRSRVRRGQDALVRVQVDLAAAVTGERRTLQVDTAVVCPTCHGGGTSDGSAFVTCDVCAGRGEISQVQRSFLGQVMTSRPCPRCRGYGTVNPRPCHECAGDGRVRTRRSLTIDVPRGVANGTRLQMVGEGEVGPGGGPAGDLYVEVQVRPHPVFTRDGDDLVCQLTLPMTAAALGITVQVETLDGVVPLQVPAGTQPGAVLRMPGYGVPHLQREGRGDILVHCAVQTPTRLDERQAALLRELADLRGEQEVSAPRAEDGSGGGFFSRLRDRFVG
jgi:molecular chaperone DnaJ